MSVSHPKFPGLLLLNIFVIGKLTQGQSILLFLFESRQNQISYDIDNEIKLNLK